jgi:acyl-CoA reductase-like NAD-dependent aldehyde dehydrogenase
MMQTISPIDGSVYAEYEPASAAEIDAALDRAVRGQRRWRTVPIAERAAACRRAVELMVARADRLATELTWQMGRPVAQSPFEIRRGFEQRARYMIDIAEDSLADLVLDQKDGFRRFIRHEPQGVVLVLAPWNYPYLASVNAVIPAIMAGNSVILKVSQQTPLVAERYAEAFAEAGLLESVFQHRGNDRGWPRQLRLIHRIGRRRVRRAARGGTTIRRHQSRARREGSGVRAA